MKFTNISPTEELKIFSGNKVTVIDGHPTDTDEYQTINALEAASEYIRHTYRDGWALPAMP